jgi:hypothetical protein
MFELNNYNHPFLNKKEQYKYQSPIPYSSGSGLNMQAIFADLLRRRCCMRMKLRTFFGVTAILLLSGCINGLLQNPDDPVVHRDANNCLNIARENALHPVLGCEYERSYQVRVIDRVTNYRKREFQGRFNDHLMRFFARSALPQVYLVGSRVDVWLAAPVLEP